MWEWSLEDLRWWRWWWWQKWQLTEAIKSDHWLHWGVCHMHVPANSISLITMMKMLFVAILTSTMRMVFVGILVRISKIDSIGTFWPQWASVRPEEAIKKSNHWLRFWESSQSYTHVQMTLVALMSKMSKMERVLGFWVALIQWKWSWVTDVTLQCKN